MWVSPFQAELIVVLLLCVIIPLTNPVNWERKGMLQQIVVLSKVILPLILKLRSHLV